jgi:glycosyltransferase involved in cell wall biosynthesis
LEPLCEQLNQAGLSYQVIRYGQYRPEDYRDLLSRSRLMVFLCEHETQGLAYQEALACDVPVLAWQGPGLWEDPEYYPHRVSFGPVSSTPYWSRDCGEQFTGLADFRNQLEMLMDNLTHPEHYSPRGFILKELNLTICAQLYLKHLEACQGARRSPKQSLSDEPKPLAG